MKPLKQWRGGIKVNAVRVHRGYPEVGVAGLVVGNRLEVHVHFAFGGFRPEAWLTRC